MATEIERKFLVVGDDWRSVSATFICQGYLNRDKERTVRIRISGDEAFITVKGITVGASRQEYEYAIPLADARELLKLCDGPLIEKNRRVIAQADVNWEVDEFLGSNEGLVVAEVELETEDQAIELPPWIGTEVTDDPRFYNANLIAYPFRDWDTGDKD